MTIGPSAPQLRFLGGERDAMIEIARGKEMPPPEGGMLSHAKQGDDTSAQKPNICPRTVQEWAPAHMTPHDCQGASHSTKNLTSHEGTGDPNGVELASRACPGLQGSCAPAYPHMPASQRSVYYRESGFWAPQLQVLGPASHCLSVDIYIVAGGDTGI